MGSIRAGSLLVLTVAACSSSSAPSNMAPGTATIDSTFTFMPTHSWASAATGGADVGAARIIVVNVAGGTDSCAAQSVGSDVANVLQLVVDFGPTGVPAPGTYALGDGWLASYRFADAACATADAGSATSGTLEIDGVDGTVHGVADVFFPAGRVIATFAATSCASMGATAGGSGTSACVQYPACPAGQEASEVPPSTACIAYP